MFIDLKKHGAYAFPLTEYPKKADGTYWADFPITYVHLSTYDIPYWDSVNEVALVPLYEYQTYVTGLYSRVDTPLNMPSLAPFVAVNPITLELYFDPIITASLGAKYVDGSFVVTSGAADANGGSFWLSTDKVEKWCIKEYALKLLE